MTPSVILHPVAKEETEKARLIYTEAFPVEEQRPWAKIVSPDIEGSPELTGIYAEGRLAGLVSIWHFKRFRYIEHFAIDSTLRGQNIGGMTLDSLSRSANPFPLLIEVEPEHLSEQAARRIAFYRRHGFEIIDRTYIQPPYADGLPSVPLWLMATDAIDPTEATRTLHSEVYGVNG